MFRGPILGKGLLERNQYLFGSRFKNRAVQDFLGFYFPPSCKILVEILYR